MVLDPRAAKSNVYTMAGIDSQQHSKLRSTIWRPQELMLDGEDIKVRPIDICLDRQLLTILIQEMARTTAHSEIT